MLLNVAKPHSNTIREILLTALWFILPLYVFAVGAPLSVAAGNIATGLMVAAALAALAASPAARRAVPSRVALALAAVLLWNAVSTVAAPAGTRQWYKLGEEWWMKLLVLAVPVLVVAGRKHLRRVVAVLLGSAALAAVYGVYQHFTGQDLVRHHQLLTNGGQYLVVGFTGHHLSYGGQLMYEVAVVSALVLAGTGTRAWTRISLLAAALLLTLVLVWTYARSSLLAVAGVFAFLALVQGGRRRTVGLVVLVLAVLGAAATPSLRARMLETFNDPKEVTRLNLWRSSVAGIEAKPVTGWGPGNFDRMLLEHEYPGYYEARGHAHNDFLMQAVNAGIPGLLAFLWFYWEIFRLLWRGMRVPKADRGLITGALACQVAALIGGMFQVFQTDDEPEMLLYFLLGCGVAAAMQALGDSRAEGRIPGQS